MRSPAIAIALLAGCTEIVRIDFPFPPREGSAPATELLAVTTRGETAVYAVAFGDTLDLPLQNPSSESVELQAILYPGTLEENGFTAGLLGAGATSDFVIDPEGAFAARVTIAAPTAWEPILSGAIRPELRAHRLHARRAVRLASGLSTHHTCAIYDDDGARCWGRNTAGQLDSPERLLLGPPTEPFAREIRDISIGAAHTCIVGQSGHVACIGLNDRAQLGSRTSGVLVDPIEVPGLTDIVEIDSGFHFTCARDRRGGAHCWGATNGNDRRGEKLTEMTLGQPIEKIAVSTFSVCGVAAGHVLCEGADVCGLMPTTTVAIDLWSHIDLHFPSPAVDIELGDTFGCAILASSELYCWGCNGGGQLTYAPPFRDLILPNQPLLTGARSIELGSDSACLLLESGALECQGGDTFGQVGNGGAMEERVRHTAVMGLSGVTQVEVYQSHACAIDAIGDIYCWGRGDDGQLGDGAVIDRVSPVRVTRVRTDSS